jgi:hypothetical protein
MVFKSSIKIDEKEKRNLIYKRWISNNDFIILK